MEKALDDSEWSFLEEKIEKALTQTCLSDGRTGAEDFSRDFKLGQLIRLYNKNGIAGLKTSPELSAWALDNLRKNEQYFLFLMSVAAWVIQFNATLP